MHRRTRSRPKRSLPGTATSSRREPSSCTSCRSTCGSTCRTESTAIRRGRTSRFACVHVVCATGYGRLLLLLLLLLPVMVSIACVSNAVAAARCVGKYFRFARISRRKKHLQRSILLQYYCKFNAATRVEVAVAVVLTFLL